MARPAASSTRRRRVLVLTVLLAAAALAILAGPAATQNDPGDPRNQSGGERGRADREKDCVTHHRVEGMTDPFIVFPILPLQIPKEVQSSGQVQIVNTWKQHIRGISVSLSLPDNETPILNSPGASGQQTTTRSDEEFDLQGTYEYVERGTPANPDSTPLARQFTLEQEALGLDVRLNLVFRDVAQQFEGELAYARILAPTSGVGRDLEPSGPRDSNRTLSLNQTDLQSEQPGTWTLELQFVDGQVPQTRVDYYANITVRYKREQETQYSIPVDPDLVIAPAGSALIDIPLLGLTDGNQTVLLVVRAETYNKRTHDQADTPDDDNYTRVASRLVRVGSALVASEDQPVVPGSVGLDARLVAGEVLGFASAGLLLPSLLLGGTYGRRTRVLLNKVLRGAKRRIEFHNLLSMGLIFTTLIHIVFFLLEARYSVLMGIMWGGLASVSLLALGLTGYYQVPLIQHYGFHFWRNTHLVFGLVIVLLVAYHSIVDGADFVFVKRLFPEWIQQVNMAGK